MSAAPSLARLSVLAALALATATPAASGSEMAGRWRTADGSAEVDIRRCGIEICGTIATILDNGPAVPSTDAHNPEPKLRNRPLLGLVVLSGFRQKSGAWRNGLAYDPKTGRSYRASLALRDPQHLILTGGILLFCRSVEWQRVREAPRGGGTEMPTRQGG